MFRVSFVFTLSFLFFLLFSLLLSFFYVLFSSPPPWYLPFGNSRLYFGKFWNVIAFIFFYSPPSFQGPVSTSTQFFFFFSFATSTLFKLITFCVYEKSSNLLHSQGSCPISFFFLTVPVVVSFSLDVVVGHTLWDDKVTLVFYPYPIRYHPFFFFVSAVSVSPVPLSYTHARGLNQTDKCVFTHVGTGFESSIPKRNCSKGFRDVVRRSYTTSTNVGRAT